MTRHDHLAYDGSSLLISSFRSITDVQYPEGHDDQPWAAPRCSLPSANLARLAGFAPRGEGRRPGRQSLDDEGQPSGRADAGSDREGVRDPVPGQLRQRRRGDLSDHAQPVRHDRQEHVRQRLPAGLGRLDQEANRLDQGADRPGRQDARPQPGRGLHRGQADVPQVGRGPRHQERQDGPVVRRRLAVRRLHRLRQQRPGRLWPAPGPQARGRRHQVGR